MTIGPETTLRELAFILCSALDRAGTTAILTGGAAATVYAPEAYQSRDLDFVLGFLSQVVGASAQPLLDMGFSVQSSMYVHPGTTFTVDFPVGPLAVGDEFLTEWSTLREGDLLLHILHPTDCVRDRLASFFYYSDFSALEQALAVAQRHPVDLQKIEEWSRNERQTERLEIFASRLS